MPYLTVDGTRLYYDETGTGTPVLFVHGLGSSGRDWIEQVEAFAGRYRVIRIDLRGHGRSERPTGPYTMAEFAREAAVLLRQLGAAPAHVVGLSMGGMVAFQLAVDAPRLVRSLGVVNSTADTRLQTWQDLWFYVSRRTAVEVLGMRRVGKLIADRLFVEPEQEELRREFVRRWAENDKKGYLWSVDAIIGWSVWDRLSTIDVPTLLVTAEHDYTPVAEKNRIVAEMPRAELAVVEGARHALPVEKPAAFNAVVERFLETVEVSPRRREASPV
ncbi:MAG: 3-oxoadipate enol-lactone hydrolase [Bacteroidetes bacterium SW_9_63_38]|nr:MAG: 3-oxoadipate enol-lactone hydrolase [Bacteroidetes bacterium SW_9_63_38]